MQLNTIISHYDLDGVVSSIIMHQGMHFDYHYKGGYKRFSDFIKWTKPGSNVVVTDACFTVDQFVQLKQKAKQIIYIDHHPDSAKIKETFTNDLVIFDHSKAGAGLCLEFIQKKKKLNADFEMLAKAANHYDLFHRKEEPSWFQFGYDLNILFWEYHYDAFFDRFRNGFNGFKSEEKAVIKTAKANRDKAIQDSTYMELEGNKIKGIVCVPSDNSIMNDVPFGKPGYDVYYMIMQYPNSTTIALRVSADSDFDLTPYMSLVENHPNVQSAGGHPQASGINFHGKPDDTVILEVINAFHRHINQEQVETNYSQEDIPF